jgi:hypothetical protein
MPTKRVRGPDSTFVGEPAFPYLCLITIVSFVSTLTAKKPDFFSPPGRPFSVYSSLILVLDLLWEALSIHETSSQGQREMENTPADVYPSDGIGQIYNGASAYSHGIHEDNRIIVEPAKACLSDCVRVHYIMSRKVCISTSW